MKTIGIDCRLSGKKHAGIGRYIEELVTRVIKEKSIKWVLFFYEENQISLPKQENVRIVIAPIKHYTLAEQVRMPFIFKQAGLDLLHVPHYNVPIFYPGKLIVTIHDLLWHTAQNSDATTLSPLVHSLKYQAYKIVTAFAVRKAARIFVPAKVIEKEVCRIFPTVDAKKIVVTNEGANELYFSAKQSQRKVDSKILFYTGSLYPHKNLMLVVNALRKLAGYELYISSARSAFVEDFLKEVSRLSVKDRVHHLGRLSDDEIISWYEKSFALVQPSTSEGFGLTGIEAMAAGLPVLASDIPVFHEIYGDAFIGFDPHNIESFIDAVSNLEKMNRMKLIKTGHTQSAHYSWEKMATETLTHYLSLV